MPGCTRTENSRRSARERRGQDPGGLGALPVRERFAARNMFERVDAFVRSVGALDDEGILAAAMAEVTRELGFTYFALTHHVDLPRAPQPAIRLTNYPLEWANYFDDERLGMADPVHRASHLTRLRLDR